MSLQLHRRRTVLGAAALALLGPLVARAQNGKPIEWVVGMAPGGGSDAVARTVAEAMGKTLGQAIIVNNKPGAATNIAADYVAKSRDVNNVLLTSDFATLAANPWLYARLPYNAEKELGSVGMLVRFPLIVVVAPDHPAKTFKDLIGWIKAQPAPVSFGSPGAGTPHHLATEALLRKLGLQGQHVPYRGVAPALQDIAGGQLPFMLAESAGAMPLITGGRVRALAVCTAQRMQVLPQIPTLQEQGVPGFEAFAWQGVSVPAGASQDTVARFNKALVAALGAPEVKARFQALGVEPMPSSPDEMNRFARVERERWGAVIRELQLKLD